jgi:hypothetical protein
MVTKVKLCWALLQAWRSAFLLANFSSQNIGVSVSMMLFLIKFERWLALAPGCQDMLMV